VTAPQCGCRYSVRWPDAPVDQWDVYSCIREYGHHGAHFDGSATAWEEVPAPGS